jgi:hypothetical protein
LHLEVVKLREALLEFSIQSDVPARLEHPHGLSGGQMVRTHHLVPAQQKAVCREDVGVGLSGNHLIFPAGERPKAGNRSVIRGGDFRAKISADQEVSLKIDKDPVGG